MQESLLRRRVAPSVPLEIHVAETDGGEFRHTFQLAFDFNAIAAVSEVTGVECLNSLEMWFRMDARMLRAMLWAALLRHQPEFDTRDFRGRRNDDGLQVVGSWIGDENSGRVSEALWKSYLQFLPKDQAERLRKIRENRGNAESPLAAKTPEKSAAAANSDGASSGPSPDTTSESPMAKSAS